mgnify:CR=1 FL=1
MVIVAHVSVRIYFMLSMFSLLCQLAIYLFPFSTSLLERKTERNAILQIMGHFKTIYYELRTPRCRNALSMLLICCISFDVISARYMFIFR